MLGLPLVLALAGLAACKKNDGDNRGPMERAGAWTDDAAKKTGEAAEGAAEETKEGVEKAGKKIDNAVSSSSSSSSSGK